MDLAHIHLLLNHFPVIGTIIGGGLFVLSLVMNSDDLNRDPHLFEWQWRAGRHQVLTGRIEIPDRNP